MSNDSKLEKEKGRIALWLDPEDINFITNEWRKIPEGVAPEISEAWARIAFRANTALHKAGITKEIQFPKENEKYKKS